MKAVNDLFRAAKQSLAPSHAPRAFALALLAVLMFIWPIAHTISLRYLLAFPALIVFCYLAARDQRALWRREFNRPAFMLMAFVLWMTGVAIFNSTETAWSLGEIRGQWIMPLFVGYLGLLAGQDVSRGARREWVLTGMVLFPLIVHVVAVDVMGVHDIVLGVNERVSGLNERPDISSYVSNVVLALLMAEAFVRVRRGRSLFAFGNITLAILLSAAALSVVFEQIRNGVIVLAVLFVTLTLVLLGDLRRGGIRARQRAAIGIGAVLIAAGLIAVSASIKTGSSWARTFASISIAWDTTRHREWLDPDKPLPKLPDGSPVGRSAYLRIAWFKEGAILVGEHPLGVGYGRNVFGHQIRAKYGVPFSYHSHSSALDLTIGTGIPGVLLWFGFLGTLVVIGWRRFQRGRGGYELALILIVVDFSARSLIDSNVRDHMLQQFMFLVGLFYSLALGDKSGA